MLQNMLMYGSITLQMNYAFIQIKHVIQINLQPMCLQHIWMELFHDYNSSKTNRAENAPQL